MHFTIKLTVRVIAPTHGKAVEQVQTAIEADAHKSSAYVVSIDQVKMEAPQG